MQVGVSDYVENAIAVCIDQFRCDGDQSPRAIVEHDVVDGDLSAEGVTGAKWT